METEIIQLVTDAIKAGGTSVAWIVLIIYLGQILKTGVVILGLGWIIRTIMHSLQKMMNIEKG